MVFSFPSIFFYPNYACRALVYIVLYNHSLVDDVYKSLYRSLAHGQKVLIVKKIKNCEVKINCKHNLGLPFLKPDENM